MKTIDIYPKAVKPKWLKRGAWCYCLGEGDDHLRVETVGKNAAFLMKGKYAHGWESFNKLYLSIAELNERIKQGECHV